MVLKLWRWCYRWCCGSGLEPVLSWEHPGAQVAAGDRSLEGLASCAHVWNSGSGGGRGQFSPSRRSQEGFRWVFEGLEELTGQRSVDLRKSM